MEEQPTLLTIIALTLATVATLVIGGFFIVKQIINIIKEKHDAISDKAYLNRNILIVASVVIKADGYINQIEIDFVRNRFVELYGKEDANKAFAQFRKIVLQETNIRQICLKIRNLISYTQMLDLVEFLFQIAYSADGVTRFEELEIRRIASYLYIRQSDYEEIRSMYYQEYYERYSSSYSTASNYHYEILGLTKEATTEQIKKTYRNLVKQYHPDRLQNTSKEDIIVAKEKFQKIQLAYQEIKKERGF